MNWSSNWSTEPPKNVTVAASTTTSNPWDAMNEDQLLMEHKALQDKLSELKATELELRKYIVNRAFPQKEEGTNNKDLGNGYTLKAVVKFNYRLADNDTVDKVLGEISKLGNEGPFIADRLVSWTPNFLKTEYTKLQEEADKGSEQAKQILKLTNQMLTITDAAPTLEIREPKVKK